MLRLRSMATGSLRVNRCLPKFLISLNGLVPLRTTYSSLRNSQRTSDTAQYRDSLLTSLLSFAQRALSIFKFRHALQ